MRVLVLNPGSSSLKATLLEPPGRTPLGSWEADWGSDASASGDPAGAVNRVVHEARPLGPDAVGYRVVHGGTRFVEPTLIDDDVEAAVRALADLTPLHNGVAASVIDAARAALPDVPHVAVFDTAFHASLPLAGYRYPVPEHWFTAWGIRRFGFHGTSVAWSVRRAGELLGRDPGDLALVVAHLGSGCSVTAVEGGRSVDTSMGMTPLEGLMMGTRAGSIDPGVLVRVQEHHGQSPDALAEVLDHESGLLGVSGRSSDVRELLAAEAAGDDRAALALELFVRRAAQGIAATTTCLPSFDGVVFTGGIGSNAGEIRCRIVARLSPLGIEPIDALDPGRDGRLDQERGPAVLRIEAREDIVIAEAVTALTTF